MISFCLFFPLLDRTLNTLYSQCIVTTLLNPSSVTGFSPTPITHIIVVVVEIVEPQITKSVSRTTVQIRVAQRKGHNNEGK